MYFRRKTSAGRAYLQIVERRREGDQVRQQVIATLGRFDELQASGQLERLVRSAKHLFSPRPIFHKLDETIRGHVFCSFLALVLKTELEERIAALGRVASWPEIIADLDSLTETEIDYDGKRFIVRSAPRPAASLALRAATIALPPTVRDAAAS